MSPLQRWLALMKDAFDSYVVRAMVGLCASLLLMVLLTRAPLHAPPEMVDWGASGYDPLPTLQDVEPEDERADGASQDEAAQRFAEIPITIQDRSVAEDEDVETIGDGDATEDTENGEAEDDDSPTVRHAYELDAEEEAPSIVGGYQALYLNIDYPEAARRSGIEGRVVLDFLVNKRGQTRDIEVKQPLHPLTDSAAVRAVRQTRFTPGQIDGERINVRMQLPVRFELLGIEAQTASDSDPPDDAP